MVDITGTDNFAILMAPYLKQCSSKTKPMDMACSYPKEETDIMVSSKMDKSMDLELKSLTMVIGLKECSIKVKNLVYILRHQAYRLVLKSIRNKFKEAIVLTATNLGVHGS